MSFNKFIEGRDDQLKDIHELIAMLGTEIPAGWSAHRYAATTATTATSYRK